MPCRKDEKTREWMLSFRKTKLGHSAWTCCLLTRFGKRVGPHPAHAQGPSRPPPQAGTLFDTRQTNFLERCFA